MAKKNSSEAFYALDDQLDKAVFSVLLEMMKEKVEKREVENLVAVFFYEITKGVSRDRFIFILSLLVF